MFPLRDFQQHHQVPVWIGEFIAVAWTNGEEQYLLDLVGVFQAWNWAWIYFSLHGYFVCLPDYDNVKPEPTNTWSKHHVGGSSLRWLALKKATGEWD